MSSTSKKSTPRKRQQVAALLHGYGAIALRRYGKYAVVEIETASGQWAEIIREHIDGNFSHIIEPVGIEETLRSKGWDPEGDFWGVR